MEFDKSKILTCVTGSREFEGRLGWFADTTLEMYEKIKSIPPTKLVFYAENDTYPFKREQWCPTTLFYPAPEPSFKVGDWVEVTENLGLLNKGAVGRVRKINDVFNKIWVDIKGTEWAITDRFLKAVPEPKHRPFNAEELCSLVGKVVTNRLTGYPNLVTGVTNSGKSVFVGTSCVSASVLLDKFTLNGEPCGMKEEA